MRNGAERGHILRVKLLKSIDKTLGSIVASCCPPPPRCTGVDGIRTVLIIRPGGIGDAVLLAPAIHALKVAFPDIPIDVLAEARNSAAFGLCPRIRSVLTYDSPAELLRLFKARYDIVIDTEQWHRLSAVVARFVGNGMKIGYGTNERSRLFTHTVPYSHDRYEAESFFDLLSPLNVRSTFNPEEPFLTVPPEAARTAEEFLSGIDRFVTIFPGASIAERRWGRERFHGVALRLARKGMVAAVVGGPGDAADGEAIVAGTGGLNLAGKCSLPETAAVIARSDLLVSGDSGILHIAVGLGVPTVSLFGPGIQRKWGPRGGKHTVINRQLSCSPCTRFGTTPRCPHGARCMAEISVDDVVAAVLGLLRL